MDVRWEWQIHPPDKTYDPFDVHSLTEYFLEARTRDGVLGTVKDALDEGCAACETFEEAIVMACRSVRPDTGKMHHHQSKVPHLARFELCQELVKRAEQIRKGMRAGRGFDWMHTGVTKIGDGIPGIAVMTVYDVCQRLACWFGPDDKYQPQKIYLHAGCKQGAAGLGLRVNRPSIELDEFPDPLPSLGAATLEDWLCCHRQILHMPREAVLQDLKNARKGIAIKGQVRRGI